jgi:hypothetical protein
MYVVACVFVAAVTFLLSSCLATIDRCHADLFFFVVETPFYLQSVYIHAANWREDWVLWLGEGHLLVPFRSY